MEIVGGLIGLLVLILFIAQVASVGAIKSHLRQSPPVPQIYIEHYNAGELNEYLQDKAAALRSYKTALFYVNKLSKPSESDQRNKAQIEKKITELS